MKQELISAAEHEELVQRVSVSKQKLSKSVVRDFRYWESSESIMGRYLKHIARDYFNSRRMLHTVCKPVDRWTEEDAWCFFDYTISSYCVDNDFDTALKRVYIVRRWVMENNDQLLHLSLKEIELVIKMLLNDKTNLKERMII